MLSEEQQSVDYELKPQPPSKGSIQGFNGGGHLVDTSQADDTATNEAWSFCWTSMKKHDDQMIGDWEKELNSLLVFVSSVLLARNEYSETYKIKN
jgi:hypothetical protein